MGMKQDEAGRNDDETSRNLGKQAYRVFYFPLVSIQKSPTFAFFCR